MSRNRGSGHYCWSCDRMRANEKFSGKGHARHLCKECARLGQEELAYRQAVRNLERLVTWEGIIPRKKRVQFRKYLEHEDERVRAYAREIEAADAGGVRGTTASAGPGRPLPRAGNRDLPRRRFSAASGRFLQSQPRGRYRNPFLIERPKAPRLPHLTNAIGIAW